MRSRAGRKLPLPVISVPARSVLAACRATFLGRQFDSEPLPILEYGDSGTHRVDHRTLFCRRDSSMNLRLRVCSCVAVAALLLSTKAAFAVTVEQALKLAPAQKDVDY